MDLTFLAQAQPSLLEQVEPDPLTSAVLQAAFAVFLLRFLDLWEREPWWFIIAMFLWGAIGSGGLSVPLNGAFDSVLSPETQVVWGAAISAPIVEEGTKGLALIVVFLLARGALGRRFRWAEFDGPTDGLVYGAVIGLGFAFSENFFYFLNKAESLEEGNEILQLRQGFLGLGLFGHAVYTGCFGLGLGLATWTRDAALRIVLPVAGLLLGMFLHAFHNGIESFMLVNEYGFDTTVAALAGQELPSPLIAQLNDTVETAGTLQNVMDYGSLAVFFIGLLLWVRYQRKIMTFELAEETNSGLITREEWDIVPRYLRRLRWYGQLLVAGKTREWRAVRESHHQLAELAFLKWRLRKAGGDPAEIDRRRHEIRVTREQQRQLLAI